MTARSTIPAVLASVLLATLLLIERVDRVPMQAQQAAALTVATLNYPAQTGDWDCTPTNFCILMQLFEWRRTGVDPGPLSSTFMGLMAERQGYTTATHGFGCGVGMELSRMFGSSRFNTCQPGTTAATDAMIAEADHFRTADPFGWKSAVPTYESAVALLRSDPTAGIVCGPTSHHSYAIIGVDTNDNLIAVDPYPIGGLRWGGPPRVFALTPRRGKAWWKSFDEDGLVVVYGKW